MDSIILCPKCDELSHWSSYFQKHMCSASCRTDEEKKEAEKIIRKEAKDILKNIMKPIVQED